MSGKFGGFSQEDINKIRTSGRNKENNVKTTIRSALKKSPADAIGKPKTTQLKSAQPKVATTTPANDDPPTTASRPSDTSSTSSANSTATSDDNSLRDVLYFKPLPYSINSAGTNAPSSIAMLPSEIGTGRSATTNSDAVIDSELVQPLKGVSLRDFESHRRMIEEQNRHKKAMLYKVIEQHSERTAAEAKKLNDIKVELAKLETNLATDVSILRKQIDAASLRYMKAQENYSQVEGVFLKAKLELQKTREAQDLLAEHLSIIIANNEDRKARKLADLMAKVGLCSNGESVSET